MFKNPTPRQIALLASLITTLFIFILILIFTFNGGGLTNALNLVFVPLLCFFVNFFIVSYLIEKFIYRRIKVIYKKIAESKSGSDLPENSVNYNLDEVENEVEGWADKKNIEIANLTALADYRRNYIGNVSHELKTPIFNIQGFLHTLIEGGINDATINMSYLQKAAKNTERLETIVNDLDTISKFESGKMILDYQIFDIHKLVEEVFEELELKAKEKNIKLSFKEGANIGSMVRADRDNIHHVLVNLIENSLKYGKKSGQTKVSFYDMDKIILIEVSDNGIGISHTHLRHLFDRFYRVDSNRSREEGGTGLGLSIVKHIVEAHNQSVHVRSMENKGSTFGFTLEKANGSGFKRI